MSVDQLRQRLQSWADRTGGGGADVGVGLGVTVTLLLLQTGRLKYRVKLSGILKTSALIYRSRFENNPVECTSERGAVVVGIGVAPRGQLAGQHLVGQYGKRVDISAGIDMFGALALLRGHVIARTDAKLRDGGVLPVGSLGDAEVGDTDFAALGQQDVGGFDIAVDQPGLMCGSHAIEGLFQQVERPVNSQRLGLLGITELCQRVFVEDILAEFIGQ